MKLSNRDRAYLFHRAAIKSIADQAERESREAVWKTDIKVIFIVLVILGLLAGVLTDWS